jgi:glycosyltransferase A (GT-A) superfamily protein (DUF2064 family)
VTASAFGRAVDELLQDREQIVIGPSDDGGYYLIGMRRPHSRLFQDIEWSTKRVLEQTIDRAHEIGFEPVMLPTFYDIDDHATLRRLCSELLEQCNGAAPATREFLEQLIARNGRERVWPQ